MTDYVPTDWVNNVTPVDAANLDKMESGIDTAHSELAAVDARLVTVEGKPALPAVVNGQWVKGVGGVPVWSAIAQADVTGLVSALGAKEELANKGAVNGYAPLDATQKVPTAHLPAASGGAELVFEGDYVPATTYQDGDYVVKDGVVYVCVGGPTTTPPDVSLWGGGPAGTAPSSPVSYGTTFPVSPINGQEHIYVDNAANPSYQWRFRYNAGSSSGYKWEYVGGSRLTKYIPADETLNPAATTAPGVPFPTAVSLVMPRAGDWDVFCQARFYTQAATRVSVAVLLGGAQVSGYIDDGIRADARMLNTEFRMSGMGSVGATLELVYAFSVSPTQAFGANKVLSVVPSRVA